MAKTGVILTDFVHPRFDYTEDSVMQRVAELHDKTLYGRIGHPPSDCSDLEYFSCPNDRERAFKITDIKMEGLACTGTVEFLDSEEGRRAEQIFTNGGRFSIRDNLIGTYVLMKITVKLSGALRKSGIFCNMKRDVEGSVYWPVTHNVRRPKESIEQNVKLTK